MRVLLIGVPREWFTHHECLQSPLLLHSGNHLAIAHHVKAIMVIPTQHNMVLDAINYLFDVRYGYQAHGHGVRSRTLPAHVSRFDKPIMESCSNDTCSLEQQAKLLVPLQKLRDEHTGKPESLCTQAAKLSATNHLTRHVEREMGCI